MDTRETYSLSNIKIMHCPNSYAGEWQVWLNGERLEGYSTADAACRFHTGWMVMTHNLEMLDEVSDEFRCGYLACKSRMYPQNTDSGQGGTVDGEV